MLGFSVLHVNSLHAFLRVLFIVQTLQQVDVRAGERISLPVLSHQICLRMGRSVQGGQ